MKIVKTEHLKGCLALKIEFKASFFTFIQSRRTHESNKICSAIKFKGYIFQECMYGMERYKSNQIPG